MQQSLPYPASKYSIDKDLECYGSAILLNSKQEIMMIIETQNFDIEDDNDE